MAVLVTRVYALTVACGILSSGVAAQNYVPPCQRSPVVPSCGRNLTNFEPCVANSLNAANKNYAKGIPALGLEAYDPLFVPNWTIRSGSNSVQFTNCKLKGLLDATYPNFATNLVSKVTDDILVPKFLLSCAYSMDSGFLGAAANKGNFELSMDYGTRLFIDARYRTCNGKAYVEYYDCTSQVLKTDGMNIEFTGLSPADAAKVNVKSFTPLFTSAVQPLQCQVFIQYVRKLLLLYPPSDFAFPPNTDSNIKFCLDKGPCSHY